MLYYYIEFNLFIYIFPYIHTELCSNGFVCMFFINKTELDLTERKKNIALVLRISTTPRKVVLIQFMSQLKQGRTQKREDASV